MHRQSFLNDHEQRAAESLDFLRYCFAHGRHPGDRFGNRDAQALQATLKGFGSVRIDGLLQRSAVSAIDTDFAKPIARDWLIKVNAATCIGKLNYRRVPFNVSVLSASAANAAFIGDGVGIVPVQPSIDASTGTPLGRTKVATIAVMPNDSFRSWAPGVRENLDAVLTRSVVRGLDAAFLSEASAVPAEKPAGILNGITPIGVLASSVAGVLTQVKAMLQVLVDGGSDLESALFVTHPTVMMRLATLITTEGVPAFPGLGALGGQILGVPAVASVGAMRSGSPSEYVFALIDGAQVAVADDLEVAVTASSDVFLQMDDATTQDAGTGTGTTGVSMFHTESTALKVIRTINWVRLASAGVAWCTAAA